MLVRAFIAALSVLAGLSFAQLVTAQGAQEAQILVFGETRFGARAAAEIEAEARALAAENREIETRLSAEERELTERRQTASPDEFQSLADAFDEKVQRIREEQDAKARALGRAREEAEQAFFQQIASILSQIVRERGALVILERRDIFLSADRIDITEEAIRRINAALGDGADAEPRAAPPPE